MKKAKKTDWKRGFSRHWLCLNLQDQDLYFSEKEWQKISGGFAPEEMEDKWFIYEEDKVVHFFRSWTGNPFFQAVFSEAEDDKKQLVELRISEDKNPQEIIKPSKEEQKTWEDITKDLPAPPQKTEKEQIEDKIKMFFTVLSFCLLKEKRIYGDFGEGNPTALWSALGSQMIDE